MTIVIETESQQVARLNKEILADAKKEPSHGLNLLIQALIQANRTPVKETVTVYFAWVTRNRLSAHIVIDGELRGLHIPEAGYRLYASYKDGYQANGYGYSKPDHILDAMKYQVKKLMPALVEDNGRIRAQLI
jgi:hypothetical protein